jgi:quercetin dioxygenase-like cupin family protein
VPLHSHPEPETFLMLDGGVEGLTATGWVAIGEGDVFHVPGGVPHAFRNHADRPATMLIATSQRLARFFREVAGPPTPEAIARFLAVAERYGYWNATPEQNAEVGLALPG